VSGPPRRGGGRRRPPPRGARPQGGPGRSSTRGLGGEQVEGRQAVRELLLAGRRSVREVWLLAEQDAAPILEDIVTLAEGERVPVREVGRTKFFATARCEAPQGVLAMAAPLPEATLDDLTTGRGTPPFLVAIDGVTDPGNLGALLRSAEGAGANGVVLPRHRAVHVTPTVTKAAAGAVEHLPFAIVGGLPAALQQLQRAGIWTVGLDGDGRADLWSLPAADGPIALVLGAEGAGLSRLVKQRCDALVRIPMRGALGSLNVAAAGALACYEVARARGRS
jgi:23S rRNA (guanosine2251-2'-O)-methyltransferase